MHFVWRVNCALLGCYAACNGNSLPTFRDNLSVPSSRVKVWRLRQTLITLTMQAQRQICLYCWRAWIFYRWNFKSKFRTQRRRYYCATGWTVQGFNPGRGNKLSRLQENPHGQYDPSNLLLKGYRCSFPGVKLSSRDVDESTPSSSAVKNEWSFIVQWYLG